MTAATPGAALAQRAKRASTAIANASTTQKNAMLRALVAGLRGPARRRVLDGNAADLAAAAAAGTAPALVDRLRLDDQRLDALCDAVTQIENLPDPVGRIVGVTPQKSGIHVGQMSVPLGVMMMIYESRPNVTVDAAALCLKAGNAVVLRGGKEALHSNVALGAVVHDALAAAGLPPDAAIVVDNPDRALLVDLLQQHDAIDVTIPRGGTGLIDTVKRHATMAVIEHYRGICHVYVEESADLDVAMQIAVNSKTQRPGVCNAMECLIVDAAIAVSALPRIVQAMRAQRVEMVGCDRTRAIVDVGTATAIDFDTEFLAMKMAIAVVDGFDDALRFIRAHGSRHTEAIVTTRHECAMRFLREVDASCVLVNASTRFNDGGELGLGAELGISTTKLHAYGPMGLEQLVTRKYVVFGHGEVRS
jgi:glutamate-5-semialdehyde dehydrogenase